MPFVHLHTHSEYSLLDGANRIPELVAHVKKLGMDSLAVTDHGNMHAAWSFYEEAKAQRERPILGFEAYLAYGPRQAREKPSWAPAAYSHLVLLAKTRAGLARPHAPRAPGKAPGGVQDPRPPPLDRIHRGVLPAAPDRQGGTRRPLRRPRRAGRVSLGGDCPRAPGGQVRGSEGERGVVRQRVRTRRL